MSTQKSEITNYLGDYLRRCGLRKEHLVSPIFVSDIKSSIDSMPGISVVPLSEIENWAELIIDKGIRSVILFGVPMRRSENGSAALDNEGVVQRATRKIKAQFPTRLTVLTDVCVCQYNTSGHCGLTRNGKVDNDSTTELLASIAASHAEAGADVVAPSAMMDGQVRTIKDRLTDLGMRTLILSYSAKHSSSLYAPFRSAAFAKSRMALDKSSYQVSYANPRQAMREIESDIEEGADMVMVKPALCYLDLIRMAKDRFEFPIAAQNVSGEYAMIKAAAMRGLIDEDHWKVNTLASIRRAGADRIISYFATDVAEYL
jgi:porphobilinogen synthase